MKMMDEALSEAKKAFLKDEVPVGAVICKGGKIIARAHNMCEEKKDCTCHAEMLAIRDACKKLSKKNLNECEMFVTVEPCAMCAGAIINARIKRLYIGASEPRTGACVSKANLMKEGLFNHTVDVYYGIGEEESRKLMKKFFKSKR